MISRHCRAYLASQPNDEHLDKDVVANDTINFSIMVWPPYISGHANGNVTLICGPLLGVLLETARWIDAK